MRSASKWWCALGTCALALGALAADWSHFRGPHSAAVSEDKDLPVKWSATENIAWKTALPGPGGSSPITSGERIFVTCYTGYGVDQDEPGEQKDLRRHLLCLDRSDGHLVWDKQVEAKLPETPYRPPFIVLHGYASSTPAADGERVYVFFGKSGVLAFDYEGKQLWQTGVGKRTDGWGSATSPVLSKDLVIVNASVESGSLVALAKKSGKEVWRTPGMRRSWSTPVLVDVKGGSQELVVSVQGRILGFDPATGKELWQCAGIPDYICPSVVARDGIVYATGGRSNRTVAVRAGGRGDVTATHRLWTVPVGSKVPSPVVHGNHLYMVNDNGVALCLNTSDGKVVNRQRLQGGGNPYASPVLADGKIYVVTRTKGTFVLTADPEFKLLARNVISTDTSTFNGSPAVSKGQLLLRSDKFLYCIGKK